MSCRPLRCSAPRTVGLLSVVCCRLLLLIVVTGIESLELLARHAGGAGSVRSGVVGAECECAVSVCASTQMTARVKSITLPLLANALCARCSLLGAIGEWRNSSAAQRNTSRRLDEKSRNDRWSPPPLTTSIAGRFARTLTQRCEHSEPVRRVRWCDRWRISQWTTVESALSQPLADAEPDAITPHTIRMLIDPHTTILISKLLCAELQFSSAAMQNRPLAPSARISGNLSSEAGLAGLQRLQQGSS